MSVTKRKKSRTKKNNQPILNYLLSVGLIIIMILMSLPKIVMAQLMPDNQQRVTGIPNATIKLPNTEYTESTVDLRVKVLGGEIKLKRTWVNGRWYINPAWAELRFIADPLDDSIQAIDRAGIIYQRTGDANLYSFNQVYLKKTDTGWQWYDRQGNCINYDQAGRITQYRDQNNITVNFVLDNQGRRTAIKDHNNELVYSFTYDNQERLTQIKDRENRTVTYQWQGNLLTQVTDVLGNQWHYGYDSQGQLNQRTEPDGGIIKLDYTESVVAPHPAMVSGKDAGKIQQSSVITLGASNKDTKVARVGKITDKTGAITLWDLQYNRTTKQYTITTDDPQGKKTIAVFDKDGQRLSTKINGQLQQTILRDTANNIVKTIDQRGQTTTVAYNQQHQPLKITYPNGATELFEYDESLGKVNKFTDTQGNILLTDYDTKGNLVHITEALGKTEQREVRLTNDKLGQIKTITFSDNNSNISIARTYDKYGNINSYTDGNGYTYHYTHNIQGQTVSTTDPLDHLKTTIYNNAGYPVKSIDGLNNITLYKTDFAGRVTELVDPMGYKTTYHYSINNDGYDYERVNPLNQKFTYHLNTVGKATKASLPSGLEVHQSYDKEDNLEKVIDFSGNTFLREYGDKNSDAKGLLVKETYPTYIKTYKYNTLGLVTEINRILDDKNILTTHISYDERGLPIVTIDPSGKQSQKQYNVFGEEIKSINALGYETQTTRDILGNITKQIDAKGHTYIFEYDKNGNITKETKALGNIIEYTYDKADRLITQKDADGNITNYEYDAADRKIKETYTKSGQLTPSQTVEYKYNNVNRIIEVTQSGDTNSHFVYTLDKLGRTTKEVISYGQGSNQITKVLQYTYDMDGNLASITYPDNTSNYYRYEKDLLKKLLLANDEEITWNQYQVKSPTQIVFPNAIQTNSYDNLQRLLNIKVTSNQKTMMDRQYTYDKASNIITEKTEDGDNAYQYDLLDRLVSTIPSAQLQSKGLPIESYAYDVINNRIGSSHQPGEWLYNSNNQLVKRGEDPHITTLTYTPNGNVATQNTANTQLNYTYNTVNRLTSIKNVNTEIASYQYDPFGRRISKTTNGVTTYFIYSPQGLIAELNQQGTMQVAYGWYPNKSWSTNPLWQANLKANDTLKTAYYNYLYVDQLGTPQLALDTNGLQTWKGWYEAFGKVYIDQNSQETINLRFPGQYYDQETGNHYNYFRDYNPNIGRYNESDPIGLRGGWNTFAYVGANPLLWYDPYGLWPFGGSVLGDKLKEKIKEFCGEQIADFVSDHSGMSCQEMFPSTATCGVCCRTQGYSTFACTELCITRCGDPDGYCPNFRKWLSSQPTDKQERIKDTLKKLDEALKPGGALSL